MNQSSLKQGDVVYRVAEYEPPEGAFTWQLQARPVKRATVKQVLLSSSFSEVGRVRFDPTALGRVFYATPKQAVEAFAKQQEARLESLTRRRTETERALAWALQLLDEGSAS